MPGKAALVFNSAGNELMIAYMAAPSIATFMVVFAVP